MSGLKTALWILTCLVLAAAARTQNREDVFVQGRVFFTDADCYSRMARVRMVMEHGWAPVRHHEFENHPEGVDSHATAPMDFLVAVFGNMLGFAGVGGGGAGGADAVDHAGAWIGTVLGVGAVAFLCFLGWRNGGRMAWAGPFFLAVSPVAVHGTALGRPDHQALLIPLLAVALGAEWVMARRCEGCRGWALGSGLAFGFALWVSLYEPLVVLFLACLAWVVAAPARLLGRERLWWVGGLVVVLGFAVAVEGAAFPGLERIRQVGEHWEDLRRWGGTIGELSGTGWRQLFGWLGWGIVAAPVVVVLRRGERGVWGVACVAVALLGLTLWQARWGYFLALAWALVLPEVLASCRRGWVAGLAMTASLWPVAWEWDGLTDPGGGVAESRLERRREAVLLRGMADVIRAEGGGVFVAPWWHSPALAYWSGAPGVAGSSHESIGGIVDVSRFYLSEEGDGEAERVLKERGVRWVLADDPGRVAMNAAVILGKPVPDRSLAIRLMRGPGGSGCELRAQNSFFKLFSIETVRMRE